LNPDISGLKPDVVHVSTTPAIYVEVKQYTSVTRSALKKAISQVRQTWQKFAARFDTPEAILLVFRLGGRSLDVPFTLETRQGRLLIQVVDVAPPKVSGSRTSTPLKLDENDLLGND
jgi:hypothetical protein